MEHQLTALLEGRRGHFEMESGYHTDVWFDLNRLFDDRARLAPFVAELAQRLKVHRLDAVCGPQVGGAHLAALIAGQLGVPALVSERFEPPEVLGLFPIAYRLPAAQRPLVHGRRIAIVDDAISAGSAVRGTHADLLACDAQPVALGALFVLGDAAAAFATSHGLALEGIARLAFHLWKRSECPLCRQGAPLERASDAQRGRWSADR
jgi:orotate phosphoribosyltransferase